MANEGKDFVETVKKCKVLLLDIEGTTTSISFVKDKLFPYAEENVKQFLEGQWETEDVKDVVVALRKLALEDKENSVEGVVAIPGEDSTKEEQIEGLVSSVKWQMSADRKVGPLKQLQGLIWKQGYDKGDIKGHVYDDVSSALEQWHSAADQKVYIYSSGSVQAQKLLFGQSLAGDLLKYIDGHFDTAVGAKQEADSYKKIVEQIGCKPEEVLFLTDIPQEAEAARSAGLHAALVTREGNAALPEAVAFPVISTLAQLAVTNKRKTDPQDEQPAKIAKLDDPVVSSEKESETETKTSEPTKKIESKASEAKEKIESKASEETVQMEVEDLPVEGPENKPETAPVIETFVVEITDTSEPVDAPMCDVEPTKVEEVVEDVTMKPPEEVVTVEEGATVITEIEEVTDEKVLVEATEVIEDVLPVVQEPPVTEEMEDLQNVGEVLDKECDEVLSKVQDVTNLDNIPAKPLHPIPESLESESYDTSDVVENILDKEQEMKQAEQDDANLATENKSEPETSVELSKNSEKTDANSTSNEVVSEIKVTETRSANESSPVEDEQKVEENNGTEKAETVDISKDNKENVANGKESAANGKESDAKGKESEETNGDTHLNGKTNGESTSEEVSSRLSAENGKVNGTNGDVKDVERGQGDAKEVAEIKVKSVPAEEPHTDPIEQSTEA